MASRTIVQLVDDLDGRSIEAGTGQTIAFSIRGQSYEIDLSEKNSAAFDRAVGKFVAAARKVPSSGGRETGRPA